MKKAQAIISVLLFAFIAIVCIALLMPEMTTSLDNTKANMSGNDSLFI